MEPALGTCGNDRLLFLHVPKTGGSWVYAAMRAAGVELRKEGTHGHSALAHVKREGRFAFAFVRDPFEWYGSWWQHCRVVDPDRRLWAFLSDFPPDRFAPLPFPQYVRACSLWLPGFVSKLFEHYVGRPEAPVDYIGRHERLEDDLVQALHLSGQEFDEQALRAVPRVNPSARAPACPDEIRNRILVSERQAYERFYPEPAAPRLATA